MKKVMILTCLLLTAVLLCGCDGYRETETGYIVTALGFDNDGNGDITVSVEVVSAGGSEISNEPYSEILTGKGKSPGNAVFTLNDEISKALILDHCNAVVLGEGLKKEQRSAVFDYLSGVKEINYGVYISATDNAEKLFKNTKSVSVARGFDIAGNIKESIDETGINYHNRFFEIVRAFKEKENYSFPFLSSDDKKIIISGETVYKSGKEIASLNTEESLIYSFLREDNSGGRVYISDEYAEINHICPKENKNGTKTLELYFKNRSKDFEESFKKETENFLKKYGKGLGIKIKRIEIKERKDF